MVDYKPNEGKIETDTNKLRKSDFASQVEIAENGKEFIIVYST